VKFAYTAVTFFCFKPSSVMGIPAFPKMVAALEVVSVKKAPFDDC